MGGVGGTGRGPDTVIGWLMFNVQNLDVTLNTVVEMSHRQNDRLPQFLEQLVTLVLTVYNHRSVFLANRFTITCGQQILQYSATTFPIRLVFNTRENVLLKGL